MNTISCLVQAEGVAAQHQSELEQALRTNHATQLDGAEVDISWRLVESGLMFTAGSKLVISDCLHTQWPDDVDAT